MARAGSEASGLLALLAALDGACTFQSRLGPETVVVCSASVECPPGLQCAQGVCVSSERPLLSEPLITPGLARRGTTVTIELEARVSEGPDVRLLTEASTLRRDVSLAGVEGNRFRFVWTVPSDASAGRYDVLASWGAAGGVRVGPVLLGAVVVDTEAPRVVEARQSSLTPPPGLPEAVRPLVTQVTRGSVVQVRVEFDEPVASATLLGPPLRFVATDVAERRVVFEGRLEEGAVSEGAVSTRLEASDPAGNETRLEVPLGLVVDVTAPADLPVERARAIEYLRAPQGLPLSRPGVARVAEVSFAEGVLDPSELGVVWLDRFVAGVTRGAPDASTTLALALRDDWPLLDVQRFDLAGNASARSPVRDVLAVTLATRTARACASPTLQEGLLPPELRDGFTPGAAGNAFARVQCPPFDGGAEAASEWRISTRGGSETNLPLQQTISRFGSALVTSTCVTVEPGDCVFFNSGTTPFELGGQLMQVNSLGLSSREYTPGDGGAGYTFVTRRADGGVLRRVEGTAAPVPGGGALLLGGRPSVDGGLHPDSWWLEGDVQRGLSLTEVPGLPLRTFPTAAFDPRLGQVVVFGGLGPSAELLGDTWLWSPDGGFTPLGAATGPGPRVGAVFGWHPVEERLFLYGGTTPDGRSGELWEFVDAGWTRLGEGPPRAFSSFRYSTVHGAMILERGLGDGGPLPLLTLTARGVERLRPYEVRPVPACDPGLPTGAFAARFGDELATVCEQNDAVWLRVAQHDGGTRDGVRSPRPDGGRSSLLGPLPLSGGLLLTGGFDGTGAVGSARSWYVTDQGLRELTGGTSGSLGPCASSTDQTRVACLGTVPALFTPAGVNLLSGPNPTSGTITWVPGLDGFVAIELGQVWRLPANASLWQRLPAPPMSPAVVALPGALVVNAGPPDARRLWRFSDDAGWTPRGRSLAATVNQGLFSERGWVFTDERAIQSTWAEPTLNARPLVQLEFDALALVPPDAVVQEGRVLVRGESRGASDAGLALHWWNGVDWSGLSRMPSSPRGAAVELAITPGRVPATRTWSVGVVGSPATADTVSALRVEEAELWVRYRLR